MKIGVLSLQGDFKEHMLSLHQYGVEGKEVRTKADLKAVDALILPGGESTTVAKLLKSSGLDKVIVERVEKGMPIWGTCAGAILLAKNVLSSVPLDTHLALLDVDIERNSYGRQMDSFQAELILDQSTIDAFFIRAPRIVRLGKGVKSLLTWKGDSVMVCQRNILATTFHSELSSENPVLEVFLKMIMRVCSW